MFTVVIFGFSAGVPPVGNRVPGTHDAVDEIEIAIALTVIQHVGRDSGRIRPERQDEHIVHQSHVFAMVVRYAGFRSLHKLF